MKPELKRYSCAHVYMIVTSVREVWESSPDYSKVHLGLVETVGLDLIRTSEE